MASRGVGAEPWDVGEGGERTEEMLYRSDRRHGLHLVGDRVAFQLLALRTMMRLCFGKRYAPWTSACSFCRAIRRKRCPSPTYVTSTASLAQLPFGRGKQFFGRSAGLEQKLVGGWQFNGITTLLSGFSFTPQTGSNRSGNGDTRNPDRPSLNPYFTGPVILGQQAQWFDPNAFTLPTAGTGGDVSRGSFRGPGLAKVDLSLFKTTTLTDRLRAEFRAECFNVQNRANLATPNAIVFSKGAINPSAGLISSTTTTSRQFQVGMKLIF